MTTDIDAASARRAESPHFVYRLFDADDRLLYIGASLNVVARIKDHKKKAWGADIARHTLEGPFLGPDAARARECESIRAERPRYNVVGRQSLRVDFTEDEWDDHLRALEAAAKRSGSRRSLDAALSLREGAERLRAAGLLTAKAAA